jgi:hypothetical protein
MKTGFAAVLGIVAFISPVCAQAPATSRSVFLEAMESAGDSKTTNNWRTYSGSYDKTKVATRELAITVRNMSQTLPGKFTIEWYFIGKPTNGTRRFLYDQGNKEITLAPSAFEKIAVESKELSSRTVRDSYYYSYGYNYKSGDKPDGWIIRAKVNGEVVRVKASSPQLELLEKNKAEFEQFVSRKQ